MVKKIFIAFLAIVLAAILAVCGLFLVVVQPGGDGVLASLTLPDGSQYMVTQRCNWGGEPYTVAFYMRARGGKWGWCYIDHEATRWRRVLMTYDRESDTIVVTERGIRRAALNRKRNTFWIDNGSIRRELDAPQSEADPQFAFRESPRPTTGFTFNE